MGVITDHKSAKKWSEWFWLLLLLLALLAMCSCSTQQRFNRLIANNAHLIEHRDTTIQHDTIFTEAYRSDTIFRTTRGRIDTLIIAIPGGGNTTIIANADKSELQASTTLLPDTIVSTVKVVTGYVDTNSKSSFAERSSQAIKDASILFVLLILSMFMYQNVKSNK